MASEQDMFRMRAAAVQAALDGNIEMATGIMKIGKMIENAQDQKQNDKGGGKNK